MIRVLLYGLGPIGMMVTRQLATRDGFRIVGAVDVDPAKVGRDVGDIAGLERPLRVRIDPDARHAIKKSKPDIVVLCTSSSIRGVMTQIEGVLKLKVPIVTTTEELSYPVRAERRAWEKNRCDGEASEGCSAVDRRQSRLRDGRAADHADRCVRTHRVGNGQPHSGCENQAAAVSAEDRRGAVAEISSGGKPSADRFAMSGSANRSP